MDRKWSVVGAASVQHSSHQIRCCKPSRRARQKAPAETSERNWDLSSEARALFTVFWYVWPAPCRQIKLVKGQLLIISVA